MSVSDGIEVKFSLSRRVVEAEMKGNKNGGKY